MQRPRVDGHPPVDEHDSDVANVLPHARIFAVGDSVMQGAGPDVYGTLPAALPGVEIDATPSRQYWHAAPIIAARLSNARPPEVVIVHLGTNGVPSAAQLDEVLVAASHAHLVVVNVRAPRDWEPSTNERLAAAVERHAHRAVLVDWWALTNGADGWLKPDGFHLTRAGAAAYAHHVSLGVATRLASHRQASGEQISEGAGLAPPSVARDI